jgi:hypothetical protein
MAPKPPYHLTLTTPEGKRLIPFDDVLAFLNCWAKQAYFAC